MDIMDPEPKDIIETGNVSMNEESTSKAASNDIEPVISQPRQKKRILRVDRVYHARHGEWHYVKSRQRPQKMKKEPFTHYSIVVEREVMPSGSIGETVVKVHSRALDKLLREVLQDFKFPGLYKTPLTIPPRVLFLLGPTLKRRLEVERADQTPNGDDIIEDIEEIILFIDEHFADQIFEIESQRRSGEIAFEHLWSLFPPACEVVEQSRLPSDFQALRVLQTSYVDDFMCKYFEVDAKFINYDGTDLGWKLVKIYIHSFQGTTMITSLSIIPLKFYSGEAKLRQDLLARGRCFLNLVGSVCKKYDGLAIDCQSKDQKLFHTAGRVMIDVKSFRRMVPNSQSYAGISRKMIEEDRDDISAIGTEDYMDDEIEAITEEDVEDVSENSTKIDVAEKDVIFCNHMIPGFCFTSKKWGIFAVSKLRENDWDSNAIDKLAISTKRRDLILSLVRGHKSSRDVFDDIISGKGRGLVGLLCGPPGTGKTLTAEVVAEVTERPLYIASSGELGTDANTLDDALHSIMSVVQRWDCVLLIDEADVFLCNRGIGQLQQNAIISVFLRRIEYFQGILLLTTNRQEEIDSAFSSRIHFRFYYPHLSELNRLSIWKNFLPNYSIDDLRPLAIYQLNGREIKNTMACVSWILSANDKEMDIAMIKDTIENLTTFVKNSSPEPASASIMKKRKRGKSQHLA